MATELKINDNGQVPKNLTNNLAFAVIFTDYVTVVVVLFNWKKHFSEEILQR